MRFKTCKGCSARLDNFLLLSENPVFPEEGNCIEQLFSPRFSLDIFGDVQKTRFRITQNFDGWNSQTKKNYSLSFLLAFFKHQYFLLATYIARSNQKQIRVNYLDCIANISLNILEQSMKHYIRNFSGCFGIGDRNARLDIFLPRLRVQLYSSICRRHFAVTASKAGVSQTKIGFPKAKRVIIPT